MKIGVFTIISRTNYGAVLQSLATFKVLSTFGEVTVVDAKKEGYDNIFCKNDSLINIIRNIRAVFSKYDAKKKEQRFETFLKQRINIVRFDENDEEQFGFDKYVTGSDQTFNLKLKVFSPLFYLGFTQSSEKISYASSFGENIRDFTCEDKEFIKKNLSDYKYISVREQAGEELIKELLDKNVEVVIDPTFMLTQQEWSEMENCDYKNYGDYILFYSVLSDSWVVEKVKLFARNKGLKVIAIHMKNRYEINSGFKYIKDAGPAEFLNLVRNAKYVLTTSFHGTVFSIIYKKNFFSFMLNEGNRLRTVLSLLGINDRIVTKYTDINEDSEIDYKNVAYLLDEQRKYSMNFLEKAFKED